MRPFLRNALTGLMVLVLLMGPVPMMGGGLMPESQAAGSNITSLRERQRSKQREIQHIRALKREILIKERHVTSHLLKNQMRLESTKSHLVNQESLLQQTRGELVGLEGDLDVALAEQQQLAVEVGKRLRQVYMKEHLSFIYALMEAGDLTTLLDRMYYKKALINQDKKLYAAYVYKTQILEEKKRALVQKKQQVASAIAQIHSEQTVLKEAMQLDQALIAKLRTSRAAYEAAENQLQAQSYSIERQIMSLTRIGGVVLGSTGRLMAPVVAALTSGFGYRRHPIFKTSRFHSGLDFGARHGTPIRAADGGRVIHSGWQGGYGKTVIINHGTQRGSNLATLYGHMSGTAVASGQTVSKGQVVGYVGSTGYSTGPHLHFEVRINGRPVDPRGYLR